MGHQLDAVGLAIEILVVAAVGDDRAGAVLQLQQVVEAVPVGVGQRGVGAEEALLAVEQAVAVAVVTAAVLVQVVARQRAVGVLGIERVALVHHLQQVGETVPVAVPGLGAAAQLVLLGVGQAVAVAVHRRAGRGGAQVLVADDEGLELGPPRERGAVVDVQEVDLVGAVEVAEGAGAGDALEQVDGGAGDHRAALQVEGMHAQGGHAVESFELRHLLDPLQDPRRHVVLRQRSGRHRTEHLLLNLVRDAGPVCRALDLGLGRAVCEEEHDVVAVL